MFKYFFVGSILFLLLAVFGYLSLPLVLFLLYFTLIQQRKVGEDNVEVLIVGAGVSGVTLAKSLNDIGVRRYKILEQGNDVGGTWFWNKYPGCCCDVPAVLYSFSWHYNSSWTRRFPSSDEIQAYIADAASSHNITPHIEFNKTVIKCEWREEEGKWKVDTSDGVTYLANVLVNATGILHIPLMPNFEGDQDFGGIKVHTARWDNTIELKGKNVGLIGTGCSGVQVLPAIIEDCKKVVLFQRSPPWVFPKGEEVYPSSRKPGFVQFLKDKLERLKLHYIDFDLGWYTLTTKGKWYYLGEKTMETIKNLMGSMVENPSIREHVIPKYEIGVKRPTWSDDYLQSFNKENFQFVTNSIQRFTKEGIETKDGDKIELDVIIYATGFDCMKSALPFEVIGKNGETLQNIWGKTPRAYKGICVPKMPNFFIMFGPSTISDRMFMSERAGIYVADAIHKLSQSGKKSMVVKEELFEEYNETLKEANSEKTWNTTAGGYYVDGEGSNWLLYPHSKIYYSYQTRRCSEKEFDWN